MRTGKEEHTEIREVKSFRHYLSHLTLVDTTTTGVALLSYSAVSFVTPWLFFFGINHGAKRKGATSASLSSHRGAYIISHLQTS